MSLNNDFNLRRLERFLSIGWNSGAVPVIVLTKADLCDDVKSKQDEVELTANGADVLITSSMGKDGYQKILPYLKEE
jgi:ribosome biogenesis GTPase